MGGLNMVGRLATGRFSDIVGRKIPGISCAMLGAVALLWLIWSQQLWMFYVFAILFGFAWGGFGVIIITLVGDIFGRRSLGTIMGTLEMGFSVGAAIGPALGGFVFDISNSYVLAFTSASVLMLFAGILIVLITREI
jgi:MFS family permease